MRLVIVVAPHFGDDDFRHRISERDRPELGSGVAALDTRPGSSRWPLGPAIARTDRERPQKPAAARTTNAENVRTVGRLAGASGQSGPTMIPLSNASLLFKHSTLEAGSAAISVSIRASRALAED